jgi:DNA polymerase III subunit alpha
MIDRNYIPLHVHSHYSLLDGLSKPSQIASRCAEIGVKSCAITDHGSISGCVQFYQELKKKNIKPILGCEIYISEHESNIKKPENAKLSHFILLAKNKIGWDNLIKIISYSNQPDRYYHKPRVSVHDLHTLDTKGLMGFCGHLGSTLADRLTRHKDSHSAIKCGLEFVSEMKDIFGSDNFFLEAQLMDQANNPQQIEITNLVRDIAQQTNTKVICTPDAHYCNQEDAIDQRILLCNNLKTTLIDINKKYLNNQSVPMSAFFSSDNFYILSPEEMQNLHTEEEIINTQYVESLCEDFSILSQPQLPPFACPNNQTPDEYLRELCRVGWKKRIASCIAKEDQQPYLDRIKHELSVLQGAGLSSYFLTVADIVDYVNKNHWLPGPGRGSAAGCLVSYLIGITSIDPIKYNLIFERFYNAGRNTEDRVSMPDIDVDVPINKRELVIEYIKEKYGKDKVAQMITFNTMKGRGALKEVLRVYGNISFEEMNKITKNIPDEAKIADELQEMKEDTGESSIIRWALENNSDKIKEWCFIDKDQGLSGPLAKRFEQAIRLEGTKSNQSKHAAGVVIGSVPLQTVCPMIYDTKTKQQIAGMEMQDLESLGMIKFDILGIAMLDKIMSISQTLNEGIYYDQQTI